MSATVSEEMQMQRTVDITRSVENVRSGGGESGKIKARRVFGAGISYPFPGSVASCGFVGLLLRGFAMASPIES